MTSLTALGTFNERATVSDVTDTDVSDWIKSRSRCSVDDMAAHVKDAVARVKFKPDRSDPQGSSLQFFADIMTELRRNRAEHVTKDSSKALISQLMSKLEPSIVREIVTSAQQYWPHDKKYDFLYFMEKVTQVSVESAKYHGKRNCDYGVGEKDSTYSKHKKGKLNKRRNGDTGAIRTPEIQKGKRSNGGKAPKAAEWKDAYLNPVCDQVHPVMECKNISDELKKDLLRKHYDGKKAKLSKLRNGDDVDGRWHATIENKIQCTALSDIGADHSALPKSIIDSLIKGGQTLDISPLNPPIGLCGAVTLPDSSNATTSAMVKLSITIQLPCGPLRLRRVEFLIVDQDMTEVLLGRPLLKCLGFDLGSHLAKFREKFDNANIDDLFRSINSTDALSSNNVRQSRLSSLSTYEGLWYNRTEDDPISPPQDAGANMGVDKESEIQECFTITLDQARLEGMSLEGLETSKQLLKEFRDIFRIQLGPDPPAKVSPLQIRLKKDHRP